MEIPNVLDIDEDPFVILFEKSSPLVIPDMKFSIENITSQDCVFNGKDITLILSLGKLFFEFKPTNHSNHVKAAKLFERASNLGSAVAMIQLANCYRNGQGNNLLVYSCFYKSIQEFH